jgi:hypothetical protein
VKTRIVHRIAGHLASGKAYYLNIKLEIILELD